MSTTADDAPPKSELQIAGSAVGSDELVDQGLWIDPARERKLVRKLDIFIAPVMMLIFLTAYLDRANIGNAASAGMLDDLGMTGDELGSE